MNGVVVTMLNRTLPRFPSECEDVIFFAPPWRSSHPGRHSRNDSEPP